MSDDNAKNYERVKRWRAKNRALANLRQREYRKEKKLGLVEKEAEREANVSRIEMVSKEIHANDIVAGKADTLAKLRGLVKEEEEKEVVEPERKTGDVVGGIYRNDQGGVISKFAWEKLQRMKEKAKRGGYVIDEYSQ